MMKQISSMAKNIKHSIWLIYLWLLDSMAWPYDVKSFFSKQVGRDYSVGFLKKMEIVFHFMRNVRKIETASHWLEHLEMARQILSIPKCLKGSVIECGCYRGGRQLTCPLFLRWLEDIS